MRGTVYPINKGVNAGLEFKGLKAQYIWYLGGGMVGVLILSAVLYICGVNSYLCLFVALVSGSSVFIYAYKLNNRYGEHGMMRKAARTKMPMVIRCGSRRMFTHKKMDKPPFPD